ncbi:MAG: class I SAM-dependent DNA methyltransferase [Pseudanabaenaceae cyanobacterium]
MSATRDSIFQFINFCREHIQGRERREAQIFLTEFFKTFGYESIKQAKAEFELPIPKSSLRGNTGFADLWWERPQSIGSIIIEIKSKGTNLTQHYSQAWEYANHIYPSPKYVILCNFDEFWIYNFQSQINTPVDKIRLVDLVDRLDAFTFMEYTTETPKFRDYQLPVTLRTAQRMGHLFSLLKARSQRHKFTALDAQLLVLQYVMAMFAEDRKLLPENIFLESVQRCLDGESSYDIVGNLLFREMNQTGITPLGRCKGVDYFNGGLFAKTPAIELNREELELLQLSAKDDWSKVRPAIFGSIFESTVNEAVRHAGGIHFTSENDIMKIVRPTISRYWEERIETANSKEELNALQLEMQNYRVLDPACGSGNFLYMAYQELKQNEQALLEKIAKVNNSDQIGLSFVTPLQFFGIDRNPFAVELARVTLLIARKVAIDDLGLKEPALPLDNLDQNIRCQDALLSEWMPANAIIGNPPFQSKNKMQQEFGASYVQQIRTKYPEISGRADYCVYWFRKAHDHLPEGGRAGLVGTNTIRQNYSRQSGLEYIVKHGGTITEAVSSQVWSSDAVVHVSIANWVKGQQGGKKKLYRQLGNSVDSDWQVTELDEINSALSEEIDVSEALVIQANARSGACYQGQTHGHEGFLLSHDEASQILESDPNYKQVLFPYLTGDELLSSFPTMPQRYVIDFYPKTLAQAKCYKLLFQRVKEMVLTTREAAVKAELERNQEVLKNNPKAKVNRHHQNFFSKWWQLSYPRGEMIEKIATIPRYIVCCQVTKRPIFEFIESAIRPNAALIVFPLPDDYSFGILNSSLHWQWFTVRCSTMKKDFRYTSDTVFDTFPFPQSPNLAIMREIAAAAVHLRATRRQIMQQKNWNLRELYRSLEQSNCEPLQAAQHNLDQAVYQLYGITEHQDPLKFLLNLNLEVAMAEEHGAPVTKPGFPEIFQEVIGEFMTSDCVKIPL